MSKTELAKRLLMRKFVNTKGDPNHSHTEYYTLSGKNDGEFKHYFPNGQLLEHSYYKDGYLDGEYKAWDSHGDLIQRYYYKKGKRLKVRASHYMEPNKTKGATRC